MIDFQNVSKRFGSQEVLVNASFRINTGEHAGMVGPNGAGKSTVAAIIAGECTPDGGTVAMPAGVSIGFLHQHLPEGHDRMPLRLFAESGAPELRRIEARIHAIEQRLATPSEPPESLLEDLGALQTAFEHAGGYDLRHRAEAALSGLGFPEGDMDRPVGEFSGGWQMRAMLTRSLIAHPAILLLDEPSNYLDLPAIEWLQRYLRDYRGTLALISHDRYLLNTLTSVTIEVANGATERYAGNYDDYLRERASRYESRMNAQRNYERKVEKAERFVERFRYKATKAAQVKSRIKMIERMESVEAPAHIAARGIIRIPAPPRSGQEIVRLEAAGFSYDGRQSVLSDITLRIERGEKLALVGHNGLGKTTLLKLIAGELNPGSGKRVLGHHVVMGYQSQDFSDTLDPAQTVFDAVKTASAGLREQELRGILGGFGFPGNAIEKRIGVLSGGEKVRLAFARLLVNPPNFLLLDEPTTHLDVHAREMLEAALQDYAGTLCMVSHDVTFVENIANGLIIMRPPGIERFPGGYRDYRDQQAAEPAHGLNPGSEPEPADGATGKKARRKQRAAERQAITARTRTLRRDIERIEKQIEIFEEEQARILDALQNPSALDFKETNRRLGVIQSGITDYTRRWEQAVAELDTLTSNREPPEPGQTQPR